MKTIILLCGLYNILFALFHMGFWKLFSWDTDLKKLTFANKAIMQILNIQLSYYFLFNALICFAFPTELLNTKLGNWFLIGNSIFWLIRTIQQFIFLRANLFQVHLLTFVFLIGTFLFLVPIIY
jgi:pheromone shutdown protein TraB